MSWIEFKSRIEAMSSNVLIDRYYGLMEYMNNNPSLCNEDHIRVLNILANEIKNRNLIY